MLLLDTHAFVWLASDTRQLSDTAVHAIKQFPDGLHVSAVSAWEVSILVKRGRLDLPLPPEEFTGHAIEHHGLTEIPVSRVVAQRSVALPDIHRDPFDRILIAECQDKELSLISRDATIAQYPDLSVIW